MLLFLLVILSGAAVTAGTATDSFATSDTSDQPGIGVGAGPMYAWVSSSLNAFDDARGWGLQLTIESHVTESIVWDVRMGGFFTPLEEPEEIYYPPDDGDWSILSAALRFEVARTGSAIWWAGPEGSLHFAQMKNFDYVGNGLGVGPVVCVDFPAASNRLVTRVGTHLSWVWLETDTLDPSRPTVVGSLAVDVLYRFRRGVKSRS